MSSKLMEYFNKQPRIGTLSTSSKDGKVDVAVFGSPRMLDEKTVIMGLGDNRTLSYLKDNSYAVFMIMEPGKSLMEWKGIRVYLRMKSYATSGQQLDSLRSQIAKVLSEGAAKMIYAAVVFEVNEVRPLVDMGQGWEKSI
ncbi:MAG: pyridoxamine 5'-phosphate oxidase family protein [Methanomicrobiales archaeon]|nr:pyridoxamine 5'-phosphate oxidase family protein [Methanomicrobiales archaeon]